MVALLLLAATSQLDRFVDRAVACVKGDPRYVVDIEYYFRAPDDLAIWRERIERRSSKWAALQIQEYSRDLHWLFELRDGVLTVYDPDRNAYLRQTVTPKADALPQVLSIAQYLIPDVGAVSSEVALRSALKRVRKEKKLKVIIDKSSTEFAGSDENEGQSASFDNRTGRLIELGGWEPYHEVHYTRFTYHELGATPILVVPPGAVRLSGLRPSAVHPWDNRVEPTEPLALNCYERALRLHVTEHRDGETYQIDRNGSDVSEVGPRGSWSYINGMLRATTNFSYVGPCRADLVPAELAAMHFEPQPISVAFLLDINFAASMLSWKSVTRGPDVTSPEGLRTSVLLVQESGGQLALGVDEKGFIRTIEFASSSLNAHPSITFDISDFVSIASVPIGNQYQLPKLGLPQGYFGYPDG